MKLKLLLFSLIIIVVYSCGDAADDKDELLGCTDPLADNFDPSAEGDDCNCAYSGFSAIGTPPATAQKNVLIEEFTGEWCGWCVDGTVIIENLMAENPGRVFTSAIHQGDFMQTDLTRPLMDKFSASSFPSGVVNREIGALGRELWAGRTSVGLGEEAKADVAIETQLIDGNSLEGVIHVDFKENLSGSSYMLVVYITESGIPASAQQNYYAFLNGAQEHPFYNKRRVLGGNEFTHNFVLKDLVDIQDISDKAIRGEGVFTRKFNVNLASYDNDEVEILAFVTRSDLKSVLNVAGVGVNETYGWE